MCNHPSTAAVRIVKEAQFKLVKSELSRWFNVRDTAREKLYFMFQELSTRYDYREWQIIEQHAVDVAWQMGSKKKVRLQQKLSQLRKSQKPSNMTPSPTLPSRPTFFKKVENLTGVSFSPAEVSLLEKGLKHNPISSCGSASARDLAFTIEATEGPYLVKALCAEELKKKTTTSPGQEERLAAGLKKKFIDNSIVALKADKGNTTVIMTKNEYIAKTINFLNDNNCLLLPSDPTDNFQKIVRKIVSKSENILKHMYKPSFIEMNPHAPRLSCLPKIHKVGAPMRPVVSYIGAPAYKLAKKLNNLFRSKIHFRPQNTVLNSHDLVNKIKDIQVPPNAKLASFDVVSLFTNINVDRCKDVVCRLIHDSNLNVFEKDELCSLMSVCMDQNYFLFDGKYYTQPGVAMGSPLSPLLADIYMDFLEQQIFQKCKSDSLIYWYRYVDDIIILWKGTERQLDSYHSKINNVDPFINFTLEFGNNHLNFLDLSISLNEGKHVFSVYRKDTYTDVTIHSTSNHPAVHKHAAFHSMINRALSIPMDDKNLAAEKLTIKSIAASNGYGGDLIDTIWNRVLRKKCREGISNLVRETTTEEKIWISIPYYGKISDKIGKILTSKGFNVGYKTKNNLKSLLSSVKDKINDQEKSGVYKLKCSCGLDYCGQTGRKFRERIKEHEKDFRDKKGDSAFARHLNESSHSFSFDLTDRQFVEFLHFGPKGSMLDVLEKFEIIKSDRLGKSLNDVIPSNFSPLLRSFL